MTTAHPVPAAAAVGPRARTGEVTAFDEQVGLGLVRADDGCEHAFHCVAVADGSRSIPTGVRVTFTVAPGLPGAWQAWSIAPASPGTEPSRSQPS